MHLVAREPYLLAGLGIWIPLSLNPITSSWIQVARPHPNLLLALELGDHMACGAACATDGCTCFTVTPFPSSLSYLHTSHGVFPPLSQMKRWSIVLLCMAAALAVAMSTRGANASNFIDRFDIEEDDLSYMHRSLMAEAGESEAGESEAGESEAGESEAGEGEAGESGVCQRWEYTTFAGSRWTGGAILSNPKATSFAACAVKCAANDDNCAGFQFNTKAKKCSLIKKGKKALRRTRAKGITAGQLRCVA